MAKSAFCSVPVHAHSGNWELTSFGTSTILPADCHRLCLEPTAATAKVQDAAQATAREAVVLAARCSAYNLDKQLRLIRQRLRIQPLVSIQKAITAHGKLVRVHAAPAAKFRCTFPRPASMLLTSRSIQQNSKSRDAEKSTSS